MLICPICTARDTLGPGPGVGPLDLRAILTGLASANVGTHCALLVSMNALTIPCPMVSESDDVAEIDALAAYAAVLTPGGLGQWAAGLGGLAAGVVEHVAHVDADSITVRPGQLYTDSDGKVRRA